MNNNSVPIIFNWKFLAMISIENKIVSNDIDFNKSVIDMIGEMKDRCLYFKYKNV